MWLPMKPVPPVSRMESGMNGESIAVEAIDRTRVRTAVLARARERQRMRGVHRAGRQAEPRGAA